MGVTIPNLDGEKAWSAGGVFPTGTHLVVCVSADEVTSSNGNPGFELELQGVDGAADGCTIRDWIYVTTASLGRVKQVLEAFGLPTSGGSLEAKAFVRRRVQIVVRDNTDREPRDAEKSLFWPKVAAYKRAPGDAQPVPVAAAAAGAPAAKKHDDDIPW